MTSTRERKDPRSRMRRLLRKEDSETTYLFSTYKKKTISFSGTPTCHSSTPIVADLAIRQRIFENQVGRALDETDDIARLLSRFMRNFIFIQGKPNKNAESGEYHTPHTTKAGVVPPVSSTLTAGFYFALTLVLPSMTTQLRTALQKIRNF